jgi:putative PIN family toxin of toxin-antitoxin system
MLTDMHFVFDTNVIISALLLKNSVSRQAFDRALRDGKIIVSSTTMTELNEVLKRKKFEKFVGWVDAGNPTKRARC